MEHLTPEEVSMVMQVERSMDAGTTQYVVNEGQRWAFPAESLADCGVRSGETVSGVVLMAIMRQNIARLETMIALDKAAKP